MYYSIIEMQECLSRNLSNGFVNFQQLSNLDKEYQIEFRKLLYAILNYSQIPTVQEIEDFNSVLSVIENRYNLPNSYSNFENSVYNTTPLKEW